MWWLRCVWISYHLFSFFLCISSFFLLNREHHRQSPHSKSAVFVSLVLKQRRSTWADPFWISNLSVCLQYTFVRWANIALAARDIPPEAINCDVMFTAIGQRSFYNAVDCVKAREILSSWSKLRRTKLTQRVFVLNSLWRQTVIWSFDVRMRLQHTVYATVGIAKTYSHSSLPPFRSLQLTNKFAFIVFFLFFSIAFKLLFQKFVVTKSAQNGHRRKQPRYIFSLWVKRIRLKN